jgi:hypothetical protein
VIRPATTLRPAAASVLCALADVGADMVAFRWLEQLAERVHSDGIRCLVGPGTDMMPIGGSELGAVLQVFLYHVPHDRRRGRSVSGSLRSAHPGVPSSLASTRLSRFGKTSGSFNAETCRQRFGDPTVGEFRHLMYSGQLLATPAGWDCDQVGAFRVPPRSPPRGVAGPILSGHGAWHPGRWWTRCPWQEGRVLAPLDMA